jgi:hypothetical protein
MCLAAFSQVQLPPLPPPRVWWGGGWDVNVSMYNNAGFLLQYMGLDSESQNIQSARLSIQSVELGPPTPSTQGDVATPLWVQGGDTLACGGGSGGTRFRHTDKKENQIFLIYKEIQSGAVAKSYMTNGLLIHGEIFARFLIY